VTDELLFSPVETVIRVAAGDKKQKSPADRPGLSTYRRPYMRRSRASLLGFCGTVEGQKKKNPGRVNAGTASPQPRPGPYPPPYRLEVTAVVTQCVPLVCCGR
jgi:hypothetical protein